MNNTENNQENKVNNVEETSEVVAKEVAKEPVKEKDEKSFSQDDINRILAKERKKWNKEKSEAERLASLSADERLKEELAIERARIAEERAELNRLKMLAQTQKELGNLSLPQEFADFLVCEEADSTKERISSFKKIWDLAIENSVNERLKGAAPITKATDNDPKNIGISKEDFKKMSLYKQNQLYINDPELYKKLTEK